MSVIECNRVRLCDYRTRLRLRLVDYATIWKIWLRLQLRLRSNCNRLQSRLQLRLRSNCNRLQSITITIVIDPNPGCHSFIHIRTVLSLHTSLAQSILMCILTQCSAQVFKRAGCHLERAHLARWTDRQKGTISTVNGRKRAQLARWTEQKGHY